MVPGCLERENVFSFPCCNGRLGKERIAPHSVVGSLAFLVHPRMGKAQLSGHTLGGGAGHCLLVCGGLSHS